MDHQSTILIVDDQLSAREVLKALLVGENYILVFAASGQEALAQVDKQLPDLILLDVMMPGMDGLEVCRRLRANQTTAEIPIIMVTSLDDSAARLQGLEAGADDFVSKPFNRAELRARIRTITRLNYHRQLRTLELQAERDRTQAILQALGEAVVVTNAEGIVEYVNPSTETLTGYKVDELVGQNWRTWQSDESMAARYDDILKMVGQGKTWRGEIVHSRKDGQPYDVALTVAPLFHSENGNTCVGFVAVHRDITPLKQAERSKNEFVSNVSHELRTPLSVITLLSDNLETLYDRLPDRKRLKMIRDIQKHTQILNDLIGDVLEISRIDSGRISMDRIELDLGKLAREQVRELSPLVQQKFQTLQIIGDKQVRVYGNPAQLKQVIRNLLNNAIKYTPDGGQIVCEYLSIVTPSDSMNERHWPASHKLAVGQWAALRVTDTGIGISQEHLPKLFNRFYRVESEQKIRGTGLGLSISRELVELHAGHIAVHSRLSQGSTFALYLPLAVKNKILK